MGTLGNKMKTRSFDSQNTVFDPDLVTAAGRIICRRCEGTSRRTGRQCGAPAAVGRRWCRFHGGHSFGPASDDGRQRCAQARTIHGTETKAARQQRSLESAAVAVLETVAAGIGMLDGQPRTRGRKPNRTDEVYPELQQAYLNLILRGVVNAD